MNAFVASEVDRLVAGGWSSCAPIAALVRDRGLPAITREYLLSEFSPDDWQRAERRNAGADEALVDGQAESGTVLKGRVRFRLGRSNRGIGSARVAPALLV